MSDKTTAAIAAEQQAAEEASAATADMLPAITLDELEQVDLGSVAQDERAPFRITDDRCADWAIRKIAEERSEYNRLKELADQQKAAIEEKNEFDSKLEAEFYAAEVLPKIRAGEIVSCELHKTYLLLPASEYCGIHLHKAEYTPDFVLTYRSGLVEIVEVKSKAVRRLQQSYVYRRRLFIDKYARPNGWKFREVIV